MKIPVTSALVALFLAVPATAQDNGTAAPLAVRQQSEGNAVLPANTPVPMRMNQEVSTRGDSWSEGDTFNLTVSSNVMLGDYVVIPQGSRAQGRITWLTSRGMFGKSGKMDIELEYVEVNGHRIPVDGTFRQEGEGATLATAGGVLLVGPLGGIITGRSAVIPADRELVATTESNIELAIPASAVRQEPAGVAGIARPQGGGTQRSEPDSAAGAD